jgi:hypothetical protein
MQKMEFSQILAGDAGNPLAQVRARSVHTAKVRPGTHCAALRGCVLHPLASIGGFSLPQTILPNG